MKSEQLSFFPKEENETTNKTLQPKEDSRISEDISKEFYICVLPFLGCDFDTVYPQIASILPKEIIDFSTLSIETAICCEIICAGICHQMNWDFLRKVIYNKTLDNPNWLIGKNLKKISSKEVLNIFKDYSKPERIRASERAKLLQVLGKWLEQFDAPADILMNKDGQILSKEKIRENLLSCSVFSNDPEEKKLQLFLQKISMYNPFHLLSTFCEPAIDYHLIRCYLRRGLLCTNSKKGNSYVANEKSERKENTIAALRQMCSELLVNISNFSGLDILTVNQIEWHIGRSVCVQNTPDCFLQKEESFWLKPFFSKCPFINTCCARCYNNDLLKINEPTYLGPSY